MNPNPKLPAGPRGHPLMGVYREIVKDPFAFLKSNFESYPGISRFRIVHANIVHVWHPPFIKHILQTNFANYGLAVDRKAMKLLFRNGLLTNDGESWREQRKRVQPAFHRDRLSFLVPKIAACTDALLHRWAGYQRQNQGFDAYTEMKGLVNEILAHTLLSSERFPEAAELGELLLHLKEETLFRFYRPTFPVWVPTPKNRDYLRRKRRVDQILGTILEQRRNSPEPFADILSFLLRTEMSQAQLIDEIINIYAAAHEPTATVLMYILYLLISHPETYDQCQQGVAAGSANPAAEDLKALKFNLLLIKEGLRLYPSVWAFTRQALREDQVGDYRIRRGDHVVFSPYFIHRHPDYWQEPEIFKPERFRTENGEGVPDFAYLPFGGGPKYCVGSEFAMLILQVVLAKILRACRLRLEEGFHFEIEAVTTLRPKNGLRVKLESA